jgi:hypothetical protein
MEDSKSANNVEGLVAGLQIKAERDEVYFAVVLRQHRTAFERGRPTAFPLPRTETRPGADFCNSRIARWLFLPISRITCSQAIQLAQSCGSGTPPFDSAKISCIEEGIPTVSYVQTFTR